MVVVGEWTQNCCSPQYVLSFCHCALPAVTQSSVTAAQALWTRQHASYWMKRYKDMSDKELKELQLAILVDLQ